MEKNVLFINPNYVFRNREKGKIAEGGLARNIAWETELRKLPNIDEFKVGENGNTLFDYFRVLLSTRYKTIFFLYPSVGISMFKNDIKSSVIRAAFLCILRFVAKETRIVFDVSDLKYEQAQDLELDDYNIQIIEKVERRIMSINAEYIFASEEMRNYACKKYNLLSEKTVFCANGAPVLEQQKLEDPPFHRKDNSIYCVYAGTLNRGRNIEKMIEGFPAQSKYIFILMGMNGEWIVEKYKEKQNIMYIGAIEQSKAQVIASICDIGLIPYDERKKYYNIAYPTKLSFYILSGIPVLSTPVTEVKNIMKKYKTGWSLPMEKWNDFLTSIDINEIINIKRTIQEIKADFTWGNMLRDGIRMLNKN